MSEDMTPKWGKEITKFHPVKPQFVLWGNIYDVYPIAIGGVMTTLRITDYVRTLLKEQGYSLILNYEPLYGLTLHDGEPDKFKSITGESLSTAKKLECTPSRVADIIEKLISSDLAYSAVILNFSSRLPDIVKDNIEEFYYRMFRFAQILTPKKVLGVTYPKFNLIIWLLDKENDLPAWYTLDNPRVKNLAVPKPDYLIRKLVVQTLVKTVAGYSDSGQVKQDEIIALFVDQTNGLYASEIVSIISLAKRENIDFAKIAEAIRMYKLGIVENPWAKLEMEKIAKSSELLSVRVKGQDQAIQKTSDIIKRSVYSLSGSQYSQFSQKPKGILFLAGPTGVGKTELAKAITELIFGSETSYIRFDMSEFSQEHADQRLLGAPPGYVGYDVGGQLTNAVKQNPFAVVLFDEIEKANPKILDIFLQILDDGRLTSGRGETTYFSECLIVFTSNLGIFEVTQEGKKIQRVTPEMPYVDIREKILESIEGFFKYKINRPEILNRLGENIIIFDFIRPAVAERIFDKMLSNILLKITDNFHLILEFDPAALLELRKACCDDLSMGGRGIGNKLEDVFINPLSRALFEISLTSSDTIIVKDLEYNSGIWSLTLEKKSR